MEGMSKLTGLLERVKAETGSDRALDAEIDVACLGGFPAHLCNDSTRRSYGKGFIHNDDDGSNLTKGGRNAPQLTASLDAALAFVESKLPGKSYQILKVALEAWAHDSAYRKQRADIKDLSRFAIAAFLSNLSSGDVS